MGLATFGVGRHRRDAAIGRRRLLRVVRSAASFTSFEAVCAWRNGLVRGDRPCRRLSAFCSAQGAHNAGQPTFAKPKRCSPKFAIAGIKRRAPTPTVRYRAPANTTAANFVEPYASSAAWPKIGGGLI